MPDVVSVPPEAKPAPLFSLDLGANGGVLAPRSADELSVWIQKEVSFWSWLGNLNMGSHQEAVSRGYQALANALGKRVMRFATTFTCVCLNLNFRGD